MGKDVSSGLEQGQFILEYWKCFVITCSTFRNSDIMANMWHRNNKTNTSEVTFFSSSVVVASFRYIQYY